MDENKIKVLMCGSRLDVKGGMVSVIKNYLEYLEWDTICIKYVPTHVEKKKLIVALFFLVAYIRIILNIVAGNFDIVYLHTAERGSFYRKAIVARTMKLFKKKVIMHHHAAEFEQFYSSLTRKQKEYVKTTLELVDLNIVLSDSLLPMIKMKAPHANVKVLYNSVKTYRDNPYNTHAENILFLGRLGHRKGIFDLITAMKQLDVILPSNIHFYFCGDGEIAKVENIIRENGLEHRVDYIGWVDLEMKHNFFKNTMINVLPSYNEGLPMTILETMAYGIPNISTNIASIPEVIKDGKNGFLIEPGDVDMLTKKIYILASNYSLRKRMSEESWNDIMNRFAMQNHAKRLEGLIRGVL